MPDKPGDQLDDDRSIADDTRVLRRVAPGQLIESESSPRPRSDAFSNSPDGTGTSVDIWEDGRVPEDLLEGHEGFGLVWLTVGELRKAGMGIVRNALPGNPHHALIQGKKTKPTKRKLATVAQWIRIPTEPE